MSLNRSITIRSNGLFGKAYARHYQRRDEYMPTVTNLCHLIQVLLIEAVVLLMQVAIVLGAIGIVGVVMGVLIVALLIDYPFRLGLVTLSLGIGSFILYLFLNGVALALILGEIKPELSDETDRLQFTRFLIGAGGLILVFGFIGAPMMAELADLQEVFESYNFFLFLNAVASIVTGGFALLLLLKVLKKRSIKSGPSNNFYTRRIQPPLSELSSIASGSYRSFKEKVCLRVDIVNMEE